LGSSWGPQGPGSATLSFLRFLVEGTTHLEWLWFSAWSGME
jgi:hypothetical protein